MTEIEAEILVARLERIWVFEDCSAVATCTFDIPGFRFRCEVSPRVFLTVLGVVIQTRTGEAISQVRAAVLEGFRCELTYSEGKLHKFFPASAEPEEWGQMRAFVNEWTPLFRRGCFLSELTLQHSAREKRQWLRYYHERGNTMGRFDLTSRRVAAAFGVKSYELELGLNWAQGRGPLGSCIIEWKASVPDGELVQLECRYEGDRFFGFMTGRNTWHWQIAPLFHELMARGLYCLGFEDEEVMDQLNYSLTAHEKLELRLSLPREFWPKIWTEGTEG